MATNIVKSGMRSVAPTLAFVALSVLTGGARADDGAQATTGATAREAAQADVQRRLREELRALMAELVESGAFGDRPSGEISLAVDSPAQRVSNLGLLVDGARSGRDDGLRVLAVTPGGGAERMGLRAGDVLTALNGTRFSAAGDGSASLRRIVDGLPNGSPLAFELSRDGHVQTLSGTSSSVELPPMRLTIGESAGAAAAIDSPPTASKTPPRGCGRVSDFDVAPRQQHLHGAKIISIDDGLPGPSGSKSYQVPAGHHVLKVAEQIEPRYLAFNDRLRNAGGGPRYKTLDVEVEADTTLLVAARLNDDRRNEWRDGAYWDPVVWKTTPERCP